MKVHKMFCIDEEVAVFLKGKNASELVNRLLKQHIDSDWLDNATEKQIKTEMEVIKLEKDLKKKIEELRKNAN